MDTYQKKVHEQIEQFNDKNQYQELPEIFHYWSNKYVVPMLQEVFGVNNNIEFYTKHFIDCLRSNPNANKLLSIGCGECETEITIASQLLKEGIQNFHFECLDLSPISIERAVANIERNKLTDFFHAHTQDLNDWSPAETYGAIMANHSLHHIVELERLFAAIKKALHPDGLFLSNDMIGRNGHMRWPECETLVNAMWGFLPDHIKYNRLCYDDAGGFHFEKTFRNLDCSTEGFEGVRAQEILPLLTKTFSFRNFLALGNLQDIFIDRCFGHNFDASSPQDLAFVDFLELLNNLLIDLGYLKPTIMFAVMKQHNVGKTEHYKHWSPEYCIRHVAPPRGGLTGNKRERIPKKDIGLSIRRLFQSLSKKM